MVKGHTYAKQLFENEAFRHFINAFTGGSTGITTGCEITQDESTISIGNGYFFIQGGLLEESGGTELDIPTSAGYHILVYEIDLSQTNTTSEFNQGSYKFISSTSEYSELTQEDLNDGGEVYQFEFCRFQVTTDGITDFTDNRIFFENIYSVPVDPTDTTNLNLWIET